MNALSDRHARLRADADHWFTRAKAALLEQLPCRRGCSRCCVGPFAITILDVAELQQGMASLDQTVREGIQTRALSQMTTFEASFPRLTESPFLDSWSDQELDKLVTQFADLPCPALDSDGSCRVYPFRPITCRTMGIPVEAGGLVEGACEVQTFVPIVRLPQALRKEETSLAEQEAVALQALRRTTALAGDEVLLPYGFLADRVHRSRLLRGLRL